jgi:hypothetical protein
VSKGLNKDGGINFQRKRNFGDEKKEPEIVEEPTIEESEIDEEYLARQARLEAKLKTAKKVNYSGFAVNGASIGVMLFGVHNVIMDPNTLELINLIETTFGIEIPYERFIELVEAWKAQLISMAGTIQVGFVYYQQTRQRMKNMDTEDTWAFMNEELNKL